MTKDEKARERVCPRCNAAAGRRCWDLRSRRRIAGTNILNAGKTTYRSHAERKALVRE